MVRPRVRQPAHTVVAVAQQFDPQAAVLVGQLIEPGIEIVEQFDQLLRIASGGEHREALNVGEQNAVERVSQCERHVWREDKSGALVNLKILQTLRNKL